ncbi:hypothetical protein AZI86_13425 [Bdellovibrio bacteriovorus]|uniref:Uncharacterized protein n=1 Tax=Bdellovibrio bacteriovorus TaxID=959 RepID=A0A150WJ50_BDEBC|nr:hypothetical protein AZI86_13425 [Bdellovibrio bacteriovorus]
MYLAQAAGFPPLLQHASSYCSKKIILYSDKKVLKFRHKSFLKLFNNEWVFKTLHLVERKAAPIS